MYWIKTNKLKLPRGKIVIAITTFAKKRQLTVDSSYSSRPQLLQLTIDNFYSSSSYSRQWQVCSSDDIDGEISAIEIKIDWVWDTVTWILLLEGKGLGETNKSTRCGKMNQVVRPWQLFVGPTHPRTHTERNKCQFWENNCCWQALIKACARTPVAASPIAFPELGNSTWTYIWGLLLFQLTPPLVIWTKSFLIWALFHFGCSRSHKLRTEAPVERNKSARFKRHFVD